MFILCTRALNEPILCTFYSYCTCPLRFTHYSRNVADPRDTKNRHGHKLSVRGRKHALCHEYSYAYLECSKGLKLKVELDYRPANRLSSGSSTTIQMMLFAERLLLLF